MTLQRIHIPLDSDEEADVSLSESIGQKTASMPSVSPSPRHRLPDSPMDVDLIGPSRRRKRQNHKTSPRTVPRKKAKKH
uniref:BZIP domain-containing protein n=1 Tax=Panagrellus redivivus TaxID=6233 RepID=A0A7E4WDW8_PANRE